MSLRRQTKTEIDQAIAAGAEPRVPRSGLGLVLPFARQRKVLVNQAGTLTPAGKHYYEKTNRTPPGRFDFAQDPQRAGRSLMIRLLDGSRKAVSRFDAVSREFKPTALGRAFYSRRTDRYTVLFPANIDITRINGSIFTREGDWMPSTAVDLGEIEVNAALSDADQRAEVRRQAMTWLDRQPTISGERILIAGYETHRLDASRELQFNKMSFNQSAEPTAVMHRPLTAGMPWSFPFSGVCPEASEETNDECVAHQLSKYIRIKGADAPFSKEQLTQELLNASYELYEDDEENGEVLSCKGFTCAAIWKLCESYGIPFHIKWGDTKLESFVPEQTKYEALVVTIWADHLYTIVDAAAKQAAIRESAKPFDGKDWVLAPIQRGERKTPGLTEWELFTGIQPGHFYSRDLQATRAALHRQSICPAVQKSGLNQLKSLRWNDCIVHALPREAEVCSRYLQELAKSRPHSIVYRAESFAGFGQLVFDSLCAVDARQPPTFLERQEVLARSGGACEMCGDQLIEGSWAVDHAVPRTAFGKDATGNYQCCCVSCHKLKTSTADANRINVEDTNPFLSRFNNSTWKIFVEGRKPHQVVANLHQASDGPIWHCDVRSCRYSAITEANNQPVPVFSPIDEVTEVTGYHLSDYMWVEAPAGRTRSPLSSYAYCGPRWYSKSECQFLLEHQICQWSDFKLALQATAHRSHRELAQKLKFMREVWLQTGNSSAGEMWAQDRKSKAKEKLAKVSLLALIGSWARVENFSYTTVVTNHPDDCRFNGEVLKNLAPQSCVFHDFTWRQRVLGYATYLPLNLIGRSLERLAVARAIAVCMKYMRIDRVLSIQVDAICFQPPKKRARQVCEELQNITYDNVHLATRRPLTRYAGPLQDPIQSKEFIYQLKQLKTPLYPGGVLELQQSERPELPSEEWEVFIETAGEDTFAEQVLQHVILSGKSATIQGPPGTGKSHLLRQIRDALDGPVEVLAPTNAAARLVEGCTVHAFITRMASSQHGFQGTVLIDEVSMLSLALICVLDNLRVGGCRLITFGDWDQLEPVGNSFRGKAVDPKIFQHSALLKRWSDCTMFKLTRCRRSDEPHFRFYTQLPPELQTAIAWTRAAYKRGNAAVDGLHLCISHRNRRRINGLRQESFAADKVTVAVPAHDGECEYHLCAGTPLVGSCTGRGFVNGAFFTVEEVGETVKVRDNLTAAVIECTTDILAKHTCLAHAVVYNRAQGCTIRDQLVVLHDLASPWFRISHLFVGLSRVTDGGAIRIAT